MNAMQYIVRQGEACRPDPTLLWDSVWNPRDGVADWAPAGADETSNAGGLRATAMLETAVVSSLFLNRRIDPTHALYWLCDGDPGGWWGDGIDVRDDLHETPLGSHLWLLERAPLTINGQSVTFWARQMALDALAHLVAQGAVVRIEADAQVSETKGRLELFVRLYGRDGSEVFDRRFELVWNQVAR